MNKLLDMPNVTNIHNNNMNIFSCKTQWLRHTKMYGRRIDNEQV